MVDKKVPRMGIIPCGGNEYSFYLDDYKFSLMENQMQDRSTDISPQQGFLFGETYDHHKIGIYVGEHEFPFRGSRTWNTDTYVVSMSNTIDIDITNFVSIKFVGGTLNNLYRRNSLEYDLEKSDDDGIKIKYVNNSRRYAFKIGEEECYLTIGSSASEKIGVEGINILDTGVYLTLEFSHSRELNFIFEHVAKIKELLSFLTFRNNVGFDEIYFLPEQKEEHFLGIGSQLFIKKSEEPLTTKSNINNITFDDLGDTIVPLLEIIYNSTDRKPAYSWGFLPDSDKKSLIITNEQIKEVCSGLECELEFIDDISATEEEHLNELIRTVKDIIKNHRKSPGKLSEKTYSLINSSINHWSMSASDKFFLLYNRYHREMCSLNYTGIDIGEDEINTLVKYRNDITHGRYRVMDINIAATAHVLSGLIYCCVLTRIGMSNDEILQLCTRRKLLE